MLADADVIKAFWMLLAFFEVFLPPVLAVTKYWLAITRFEKFSSVEAVLDRKRH